MNISNIYRSNLGGWLALNILVACSASAARLEFKYDPLGQLASAQDSDGDTLSYAYDEVSNMVGLSVNRLEPGQSAIQWAAIGNASEITISLPWATAGSLQVKISKSPDFRNSTLQTYRGQAIPIPFALEWGTTPIYVQYVDGGGSYVLETAVIRSPIAPEISIEKALENLQVLWPLTDIPWTLEQSPSVTGVWSPVSSLSTTNGNTVMVSIERSAATQFYRLSRGSLSP
jgi:YD repeat-containing protein